MNSLLRQMKNIKPLINFFLIFSFIYLIMCPFAQVITPSNGSPVLIPQRQPVENHYKQKDHIFTHLNFFIESRVEMWVCDKGTVNLFKTIHQEPAFGLSIVTTSRLII